MHALVRPLRQPRLSRAARRVGLAALVLALSWGAAGPAQALRADGSAPSVALPPTPHWRLVGSDDFSGPLDLTRWTPYSGKPGCCADTVWDASQVVVRDGALELRNNPDSDGTWLSGGVGGWSWSAATRLHGRWDARVRMDVGGGVSATALLWPVAGWPPEVNYFEVFETWPLRDEMAVTTHFSKDQAPNQSQWIVLGDFTQGHVVSVRWTPTRLSYFVDGVRVLVETDPDRIPRTAMWPAFQTHVHRLSDGHLPELIPGQKSISMRVDWVRVYERAGTTA
jgi:licheninase